MAKKASAHPSAVLFVLIGWTKHYDGTEIVEGDFKFLEKHPKDNAEARAFIRQGDGYYRCGAGDGNIEEKHLDVVFVARSPAGQYLVVAIYRRAAVSFDGKWATIESKNVTTYGINKRPRCTWPVGRGMRRWARRIDGKGRAHAVLLNRYIQLKNDSGAESAKPVDLI